MKYNLHFLIKGSYSKALEFKLYKKNMNKFKSAFYLSLNKIILRLATYY